MSEHLFNALEHKVDQLISRLNALEVENQRLRESEHRLKEERTQLLQINAQTQSKIEAMISRLKSLEHGS
ncbi:MAG: TIGR02449 family protein [Oceanospirillales bacterium]|jgi:cell division protein ZapB|nr:MAG: TIGR02449 family protein [Oceanospirillales bacterium]